jgi:hypothetical protein
MYVKVLSRNTSNEKLLDLAVTMITKFVDLK